MGTVASDKDRLIELEQHVASVMARYRENSADARVKVAVLSRLHRAIGESMEHEAARAWESAIFWLIEGDSTVARKRVEDWAALDFGPALDRYIAMRLRWLDPERDYDQTLTDVDLIRKELAAAQALRAERDRAEAEALAAV